MKDQVAASAVAFASLWREGVKPAGDVILALTADEEVNEGFGLSWLVEEHPELVRADYALNEGGGERCVFGTDVFYLCATGEKMSAPFRIRVQGRSGHASVPSIADNALVKAGPIIEALDRYRPPQALIPEVARFLELVLGEHPPLDEALDRARLLHPLAAELVEPLLSFTLAPTMVEASKQINVIPAECVVTVDCRLPPGMTPDHVDPLVRAAIGPGDYDLEWLESDGGTRSPLATPLWSALEAWVGELEPGARLAPIVCAGFTDSHWMREAFGTVAYGFFPQKAMDPELAARLVHSADERIPVADLELGVHALRAAAISLGA
jgi:acetylornithine deacetylase/succinyl-diaminopimelate desuccinylase-like protein